MSMTDEQSEAVRSIMVLFDVHVAGKLTMYLDLIKLGHAPAALELEPGMRDAVRTWKREVARLIEKPEIEREDEV